MDDDVEEVGAMLPVEVLMKSSFPRRRRQGDCCSCCCFYRLLRHRHRHRYSCCYDRCRDEGRYDKGFRSNGCGYGRTVGKQFETTTMTLFCWGFFSDGKIKKTFFFLFGGEEDGFLEEGVKSKSPC